MVGGRRTRHGLVLALILLSSLISTGESKYPDSGADTIGDAPKEDFVRVANVSEDSKVQEEDADDLNDLDGSEDGFGKGLGIGFTIPEGGSASKIPVPKAGSEENIPPISVLLNKVLWLEIGNRTLNGSGPYGSMVVDRLPVGSPDFNRLLEGSGYAKVREFENETGSCDWWADPGAPKLSYGEEEVQDQSTETVQVKRFYVGWAYSNTYHYPDCRWAKNIPLGSQVWFSSPEEAKAKGYVPCSTCNPP